MSHAGGTTYVPSLKGVVLTSSAQASVVTSLRGEGSVSVGEGFGLLGGRELELEKARETQRERCTVHIYGEGE